MLALTRPPDLPPDASWGDAAPWAAARVAPGLPDDLDDDVTARMADLATAGRAFALATIVAADGGPRPVGSQLLVTAERWWGFLSGGCVEADVARHARAALADGQPRRLAYGRGSPFFDIRLPCGGRVELLVEVPGPGDPAMAALAEAVRARRPVRYLSDGRRRACLSVGSDAGAWEVDRLHEPAQRLIVVGADPFALAMAAAGRHQGWEVVLVRPGTAQVPLPPDVIYLGGAPDAELAALALDEWTAVAVATHDAEDDGAALLAALRSPAGYVGALGSRRRLGERRARLLDAGLAIKYLNRLHAPIGLAIGARSPRDVAVGVIAEIVAHRARRERP